MTGSAALLEVGAGCDADCLFCRRNETRRLRGALPQAVDHDALRAFLRLASLLGLERLILGGDEPTVLGAAAVERMVRLGRRAGFREIALYSNAIELGRSAFTRRLAAAGVNAFFLPLYGPDAAGHDAVTQRPGSFKALSAAVAALRRLGTTVKTELHTVRLRQNEEGLEAMRALAAAWELPLEVHELRRREDPVAYEDLRPRGRPAEPRRAGGRGPARGTGKAAELRYSVLLGQLNYGEDPAPEVARLLSGGLGRLGLPKSRLARVLKRYEGKPAFRDPARLLRVLEAKGDGFDVELLMPSDAVEALELGLRTLRQGRKEQARRALRDAALFTQSDRKTAWAKEQALSVLERLEEPCRR